MEWIDRYDLVIGFYQLRSGGVWSQTDLLTAGDSVYEKISL